MLRHYLKTTLRVLGRSASFSAINLTGLSIGIASAFLLLLFVRNEITFDSGHAQADRIYRAWVKEDYGEDQSFFNTITPIPLGPALQAAVPEIEQAVRFDRIRWVVRRDEFSQTENLHLVDEQFLNVFDFPAVEGNRESMLSAPGSIVLTQRSAQRYFGSEAPLGKLLTVEFADGPRQFEISGVLEDPPENSSLQFDFLLSYENASWYYPARARQAWFNVSAETYVLLRAGADPSAAEAKLPAMVRSVLGDRVQPGQYQVGLQPLLDIHMNPDFPQGYSSVISPSYVRILIALALLILAIACINFVTLSISRSLSRAKEVGVRKVIGADRGQLMVQYWGEALLLTGLSVVLGMGLAALALPTFNQLAERSLFFSVDLGTGLLALGLFATVGGLAGLYPALLLSRFSPIQAFRGAVTTGADRSVTRRSLVVIQFALAIILMASTLAIGRQLDYLRSRDLGFSRESVVTIPTSLGMDEGRELVDRFAFRAARLPEVVSVAGSAALFDQFGWPRMGFQASDGSYKRMFFNLVETGFVETMGLRVDQGRSFSRDQPGDASRAIMVNQALVRSQGWTDPLAQRLPGAFEDHEIIGVLEDFNFASLHNTIEPAVLAMNPSVVFSGLQDMDYGGDMGMDVLVRVQGGDIQRTLGSLRAMWEEVAPEIPFSYAFVDEALEAQYRQETRLARIINIAAMLSILIAGLGLFGLAAVSVARRSKEVGLRKVLGASSSGIVVLFAREFTLLVGVAFVLATPVAWIGTQRWMDAFAYRVSPTLIPFLAAGIAAVGVMLIAVASQTLRAAWANPVDSLRDE